MKRAARSWIVAVLVFGLTAGPSVAATERPLGLVTQAQQARLDNAALAIGTTVYPGDTVATDAGGGLRLKLGDSQLYLLADSAATLAQNANAVHAIVDRGTVGFSSNGVDNIELQIPQGILRAANGQPAYGQVTILGPLQVAISAFTGTLVLDNDGELHEIPAGKSYRVTMDLEPASQPQAPAGVGGPGPNNKIVTPKKRHLVFDIIVVSAVGVISYVLWYHWSESPSAPSNLQVQ